MINYKYNAIKDINLFILYNLIFFIFFKKIPEDKVYESPEEIVDLRGPDGIIVLAFGKDELLITSNSKVKKKTFKEIKK